MIHEIKTIVGVFFFFGAWGILIYSMEGNTVRDKALILRFKKITDQDAMDNLIKDLEVALDTQVDILSEKQIRKTKEERSAERTARKLRKEQEAAEGKKRKRISKNDPEKEAKKKKKLDEYSNLPEVKGRKMLLSKCRRLMLSEGLKKRYPDIYKELYAVFIPALERPKKEPKEPSKKRKRSEAKKAKKTKKSAEELAPKEDLISEADLEKTEEEPEITPAQDEDELVRPKKKPRICIPVAA